MVETFIGYLEDEKNRFGIKLPFELVRFIVIVFMFLCGIVLNTRAGFYFLNLFDTYTTVLPMMLAGFLECLVFLWKYNFREFEEKVFRECHETVPTYLKYSLKYVDGLVLLILIILSFVDLVTYSLVLH
jgi:Na+-dependent transporters of the SNF family